MVVCASWDSRTLHWTICSHLWPQHPWAHWLKSHPTHKQRGRVYCLPHILSLCSPGSVYIVKINGIRLCRCCLGEKEPAWTLLVHSYHHFCSFIWLSNECSTACFLDTAPLFIPVLHLLSTHWHWGAMLHPESADSVSPSSPLQSGWHPQSPS